MKKLFIVLAFLALFSCQKTEEEPSVDPNTGTVTFWTTEASEWTLYVDDIKIGSVWKPYPINTTDKIPVCGDKQFLKLSLLEGKHYYHMTVFIPTQPPPNYFVTQDHEFDIVAKGCIVVRVIQ